VDLQALEHQVFLVILVIQLFQDIPELKSSPTFFLNLLKYFNGLFGKKLINNFIVNICSNEKFM
jgi:hypothetical protein